MSHRNALCWGSQKRNEKLSSHLAKPSATVGGWRVRAVGAAAGPPVSLPSAICPLCFASSLLPAAQGGGGIKDRGSPFHKLPQKPQALTSAYTSLAITCTAREPGKPGMLSWTYSS